MVYLKSKKEKGFTLVEVLITLAIFSIIVVSIFGIFSSSIKNQRYVLLTDQLIDESSFTIDYMSKIIRLAKKHIDDPTSPDPVCNIANFGDNYNPTSPPFSSQITFIRGEIDESGNIAKKCYQFSYDSANKKVVQTVDGIVTDLTPSNIEITNLKFYISGGSQDILVENPNYQPRITVLLEARAKNSSPISTINMQTTVSQRDIDIPY
jgi:prepilin-type N-terminal cleavage/methylation domain-containing protein